MTSAIRIDPSVFHGTGDSFSPNLFAVNFGWVWKLIKIGFWVIVAVVVIGLLILLVTWLIKQLRGQFTPQEEVGEDIMKSAESTKRSDIKKVYRYDDKGIHLLGEYLGEYSRLVDEKVIYYILVGHKKVLPIPRSIHNFIWKVNFIYIIPEKSLLVRQINGKTAYLLASRTFQFSNQTKTYTSADHFGLPKIVNQLFLNDSVDEFYHKFTAKIYNVLDKGIESNPFVNAKIKTKREYAEGEEDE